MLLCVAIGGGVAAVLGWPSWAGYGIVALFLLCATGALAWYALGQLNTVRALPKTTETLKENFAWMQTRR